MPLEVQIRTLAQDGWAQFVERLADSWGRGIRYGEDPEVPDAASGLGSQATRREVVAMLIPLSDALTAQDLAKEALKADSLVVDAARRLVEYFDTLPVQSRRSMMQGQISPDLLPIRDELAQYLSRFSDSLSVDDLGILEAGPELTGAELFHLTDVCQNLVDVELRNRGATLEDVGQHLRAILQMLAGAT